MPGDEAFWVSGEEVRGRFGGDGLVFVEPFEGHHREQPLRFHRSEGIYFPAAGLPADELLGAVRVHLKEFEFLGQGARLADNDGLTRERDLDAASVALESAVEALF